MPESIPLCDISDQTTDTPYTKLDFAVLSERSLYVVVRPSVVCCLSSVVCL